MRYRDFYQGQPRGNLNNAEYAMNPEDQHDRLPDGPDLQAVDSAAGDHGMEPSLAENQILQQILDNSLTEIGLILSSTRDFQQVYYQFADQVKKS